MDNDFPSPALDPKTVTRTINAILSTDVVIGESDGKILPISRKSVDGSNITFCLPSFYERYFKLLIYRVNSLALLLKFWVDFTSSDPTIQDNSWITLAQHLVYFKNVLESLDRSVELAPMESSWRCRDFDRVLVMELVVHRHEPIFAYAYRASRSNSDPNINTCSLDALDLEAYFDKIGDTVSGRSNNFRHESQGLGTARALLGPILAHYSNSERIEIFDPYEAKLARYGLPSREAQESESDGEDVDEMAEEAEATFEL